MHREEMFRTRGLHQPWERALLSEQCWAQREICHYSIQHHETNQKGGHEERDGCRSTWLEASEVADRYPSSASEERRETKGALKWCGRCCANLPTGTSGCSSSGTLWQQPFMLLDDHPSWNVLRAAMRTQMHLLGSMDSGSWWDANSQTRAIALGVATG